MVVLRSTPEIQLKIRSSVYMPFKPRTIQSQCSKNTNIILHVIFHVEEYVTKTILSSVATVTSLALITSFLSLIIIPFKVSSTPLNNFDTFSQQVECYDWMILKEILIFSLLSHSKLEIFSSDSVKEHLEFSECITVPEVTYNEEVDS
uniref:Uncharacterized protein n=1 Tax=Onchocerca volvulus TaxID=6282 RepID=A0A8R1XYR7_ONCVO